MPWKRGYKFRGNDWPNAPKETAALYLLCRQAYVDVVGSGLLYKFRKFHFSSPTTMLNYLLVINPRHKNAMRSIKLDLNLASYLGCFREEPPRSCGRPFEMIASCKSLQHFTLNIKFDWGHYRAQWVGNWPSRSVKSISVKENILKTITDCVALKSIRGLKSFELLFTFTYTRSPFDENHQERLLQVGEEIRKLVTAEQE